MYSRAGLSEPFEIESSDFEKVRDVSQNCFSWERRTASGDVKADNILTSNNHKVLSDECNFHQLTKVNIDEQDISVDVDIDIDNDIDTNADGDTNFEATKSEGQYSVDSRTTLFNILVIDDSMLQRNIVKVRLFFSSYKCLTAV